MDDVLKILSAVGSVATAVTVYYLYLQVRSANRIAKLDHQRSRRQVAYDMCFKWTTSLSEDSYLILALFETIDISTCKSIVQRQSTKIAGENNLGRLFLILRPVLPDYANRIRDVLNNSEGEKSIMLDKVTTIYLRNRALTFANLLETIFVGWRLEIADQETLCEQFTWMQSNAMKNLREALGIQFFPATEAFCAHLAASRS
jgi:hypothetical protein